MVLLRLGWWILGWKDEFPYSPNDIVRNPSSLQWRGNQIHEARKLTSKSAVIWFPPANHVIKWNVDASVQPIHSRSAIGGVLRDHNGKFICLFSSPIPFMEINSAEIIAIHRAIKISLTRDMCKGAKIILESDSANAVRWSNGEEGGPCNLNFQLNFIRNAKRNGLDISIVHMGRSANFVADSLAKQGIHRQSDFIAWL
ncbi:uncharacterized protein LOC125498844 [Beta vulgaris subsp. vulgaris]|uniref:uncharacterized protein LOC125498844 n=1 Tax=Beta vulgaris subsp. vulgaris TaxID=3555 RepID=UPI002036C89D|nr:uncharacterized protein LOC125498844 [Beta vulgaris subsp. vulgaris]